VRRFFCDSKGGKRTEFDQSQHLIRFLAQAVELHVTI
jgi:hypothetical protein